MKLVQFGAGNIGRAFVGQLFARAGWEVVFVEVDPVLIEALNHARRYIVEIRDEPPGQIPVENVRAVDARERALAAEEVATADMAATAVGPHALDSVYPLLAGGLVRRRELRGGPLDILICENLRSAADVFRENLGRQLPEHFDIECDVGLVETSIGKMVPLVSDAERARDPLTVYAEAFNTLIVDGRAFKRPVPEVPGLDAKDNIAAYVDRKSFIHNLGHAAAAYVGFAGQPERIYLWEVMDDPRVEAVARCAMWESGKALIAEYPDEFDHANQGEHIEDLLRRFRNRRLGDTVYRVGRDLFRKLGPADRVMGALRLQMKHGVEPRATTAVLAAALMFRATDDEGVMFEDDARFAAALNQLGPRAILADVCGLDARASADLSIIERAARLYERLRDDTQRQATVDEVAAECRAAVP